MQRPATTVVFFCRRVLRYLASTGFYCSTKTCLVMTRG